MSVPTATWTPSPAVSAAAPAAPDRGSGMARPDSGVGQSRQSQTRDSTMGPAQPAAAEGQTSFTWSAGAGQSVPPSFGGQQPFSTGVAGPASVSDAGDSRGHIASDAEGRGGVPDGYGRGIPEADNGPSTGVAAQHMSDVDTKPLGVPAQFGRPAGAVGPEPGRSHHLSSTSAGLPGFGAPASEPAAIISPQPVLGHHRIERGGGLSIRGDGLEGTPRTGGATMRSDVSQTRVRKPSQVPQDPMLRFLVPVTKVSKVNPDNKFCLSVKIEQIKPHATDNWGPFGETFAVHGNELRYTPIVLARHELVPFDGLCDFDEVVPDSGAGHQLQTQFTEWQSEGYKMEQMPLASDTLQNKTWAKFWRGDTDSKDTVDASDPAFMPQVEPQGGLHLNGLRAFAARTLCFVPPTEDEAQRRSQFRRSVGAASGTFNPEVMEQESERKLWATWVPGVAPYDDQDELERARDTFCLRENRPGKRVAIMIPMYNEPCGPHVELNPGYYVKEVAKRGHEWFNMAQGKNPKTFQGAGTIPGTLLSIAETLREVRLKECRDVDHLKGVPKADRWITTLVADGRNRITKHGDLDRQQNLRNLEAIGMYCPLDHLFANGPDGAPSLMSKALATCDFDNTEEFNDEAKKYKPRYKVNGHTVHAHLFERTIYFTHNDEKHEMKMMFLLKEFNGGKLDSQLWFFEGLVKYMRFLNEQKYGKMEGRQVEIATPLIDAGTIPRPHPMLFAEHKSPTDERLMRGKFAMPLGKIVQELLDDESAAGTCGAISVAKHWGEYWFGTQEDTPPLVLFRRLFFAPHMIELAQHFEYTIGNLMDKSAESYFGYISVLPGAFSSYRYTALTASRKKTSCCGKTVGVTTRPLDTYFRSITDIKSVNPFVANMILAEDRLLCFDLLCFKNYKLKFVTAAPAFTDVPSEFGDLIRQRRRWINGSFFALVYALHHFLKLETFPGRWQALQGQCCLRSRFTFYWDHFFFACVFAFHLVGALLAVFMVSMLYLGYYLILRGYADVTDNTNFRWVVLFAKGMYLSLLGCSLVGALVVKTNEKAKRLAGIGCCWRYRKKCAFTPYYFHILALFFQWLFYIVIYLCYKNLQEGFQEVLLQQQGGGETFAFADMFLPNFSKCDPHERKILCPTVRNSIMGFVTIFGVTFAVGILQLSAEAWHHHSEGHRSLNYLLSQVALLFAGFFAYLMLLPAYVNILMVFAFANLHDTSWGTKGLDNQASDVDQQASEMREFRICVVLIWIMLNGMLVMIVTSGWNDLISANNSQNEGGYDLFKDPLGFLQIQFLIGFGMTTFKGVGAMLYLLARLRRTWVEFVTCGKLRRKETDRL